MATNDTSNDYWFTEAELPYGKKGLRLSTLVTNQLYHEKTPFGDLEILETPFYGRILTLDGIIQTSTYDEFIYHEMMVLAPSLYTDAPKSVLVIGGGDGGAIKQALRLGSVERITMVEIDTKVVELSKQYLPSISGGAFDDPRVELILQDGKAFLENTTDTYDIIVMDLTDPLEDSPAEDLFTTDFYKTVRSRLTPTGVAAIQCGSLLFQPGEVKGVRASLAASFANTFLHTAVVPGYQLSSFGFIYATDNAAPTAEQLESRYANISGEFDYLTPQMFAASQAIPPYLQREIENS